MATSSEATLNVRPSVRDLQSKYDSGDKQPLEDLVAAWVGIQNLPPDDPKSFFVLGGYYGEPFDYRPQVDALPTDDIYTYWGGYCNHGNVLFPTWHRIYVLKMEEALQSIVPGVMMPFWDETSKESLEHGISSILTQEKFELNWVVIDNPLRSFTLPEKLTDDMPDDDKAYAKPKGYETVRYPLSGLVGTPEAKAITDAHNAKYPDPDANIDLLNENVVAWLNGPEPVKPPPPTRSGVYDKFHACLFAPNYTVFSNTTSSAEWNLGHPEELVIPLESPHNDIHLSVGGFDAPKKKQQAGLLSGANGDMGENNTAGLDPIFFFHHCNVDRMF